MLDGPIGQKMLAKLPDNGLIGLGYWDHGFRIVTNSRRPITKVEDFAGLKIRVPQSNISIETFNALGVQRGADADSRAVHGARDQGGRRSGESVRRGRGAQVQRGAAVRLRDTRTPTTRWSCSSARRPGIACRRTSARSSRTRPTKPAPTSARSRARRTTSRPTASEGEGHEDQRDRAAGDRAHARQGQAGDRQVRQGRRRGARERRSTTRSTRCGATRSPDSSSSVVGFHVDRTGCNRWQACGYL